MSWASTIAGSVSTPNQSSRNGRAVTGWIIHHNAARDGRGVLEMMRTGSKSVSANYQVLEGGDVWGVVPRENRSWSASNADWDAASLTFEIANNSGEPGWTISERAYQRVAATIAEDSKWAGIPINRTTVRGHREGSAQGDGDSYATACPGGIDLDRLVDLANSYLDRRALELPATEEDVIIYISQSASKDGLIPAGFSFIQGAAGPLRPLSQAEYETYMYYSKDNVTGNVLKVRVASWPGEQIRDLVTGVGVMEWNGLGTKNNPQLTGNIIK